MLLNIILILGSDEMKQEQKKDNSWFHPGFGLLASDSGLPAHGSFRALRVESPRKPRFWEGLQAVRLSQKLPHLEEDVLHPWQQSVSWIAGPFFLRMDIGFYILYRDSK